MKALAVVVILDLIWRRFISNAILPRSLPEPVDQVVMWLDSTVSGLVGLTAWAVIVWRAVDLNHHLTPIYSLNRLREHDDIDDETEEDPYTSEWGRWLSAAIWLQVGLAGLAAAEWLPWRIPYLWALEIVCLAAVVVAVVGHVEVRGVEMARTVVGLAAAALLGSAISETAASQWPLVANTGSLTGASEAAWLVAPMALVVALDPWFHIDRKAIIWAAGVAAGSAMWSSQTDLSAFGYGLGLTLELPPTLYWLALGCTIYATVAVFRAPSIPPAAALGIAILACAGLDMTWASGRLAAVAALTTLAAVAPPDPQATPSRQLPFKRPTEAPAPSE